MGRGISSRVSGAAAAAVIASGALLAGCGGDDEQAESTPAGSPAAAVTTTGGEGNKIRKCEAFKGSDPSDEQELTYTGPDTRRDNDGVMGKLVNDTGATVWVLPRGYTNAWAKRECTLEKGASTYFSKNGGYVFAFRPEARDADDKPCEFATCIRLVDPYVGYPEFSGSVDREVFSKPQYKVEQKENQENSFVRGSSRVTVKREKDGYYDRQFPDDYRNSKMSDWAQYTVRVEGLINF
jgi:hypothetical protein